ncbi:hypothetical protein [Agrobacterium rosae]|uniref:hypothetical protein n=1 Tax=Agrobacterium rosae TaxID=1972867 RepID=UPI003A7FDECD
MNTIITIGDLFPRDTGMILVAKDATNGSSRHISMVANGAACGCQCFGCGRRLIARNGGEVRTHSFAHRPEDMVTDCFSSGETALHLRAKEIIAKHCRITLPETFTKGLDGALVTVSEQRSVKLTDVELEAVAGELIPDVTATMPDGRRIFIEIANTHPCPPEKIEKLDLMGVDVLEIIVSSYRDVPLDELDDIIIDIAPRKMIHSSEVKAMAAQISEERQRHEQAKRAEAERLVEAYRDPAILNHVKAQALVDDLVQYGLSQHMDIEDDRPSAFIIYRRQWQAAVLNRLYNGNAEFLKPVDLLEIFAKSEWPKPEIAYTTSDDARWIAANVAADFKSPYEEVFDYLSRLRAEGAVYEVTDRGFALSDDLYRRIGSAIERKNRPERRMRELSVAFRDVGTLVPNEDGPMPVFDHWLRGRAAVAKLSLEQLLVDDSGKYDALIEGMRGLNKTLRDMRAFKKVVQPPDMAGLPIEPLINRLMTAIVEEAKREHAELVTLRKRQSNEVEELRRKEAADRVQRLSGDAMSVVPDIDGFLDSPLPDQFGKTPRQLASESYQGFNQAQSVLSNIRELRRAAEREQNLKQVIADKLLERVHYRILRKEMAELWPKSRLR